MHGAEHRMRRYIGGRDRIAASGLVADDDPFGSPITRGHPHERLSVTCDGETCLAPWQFMRTKEFDAADPVLDRIEVKWRSPFREPLWNVLHDHMVAPTLPTVCWWSRTCAGFLCKDGVTGKWTVPVQFGGHNIDLSRTVLLLLRPVSQRQIST